MTVVRLTFAWRRHMSRWQCDGRTATTPGDHTHAPCVNQSVGRWCVTQDDDVTFAAAIFLRQKTRRMILTCNFRTVRLGNFYSWASVSRCDSQYDVITPVQSPEAGEKGIFTWEGIG